ncbi:hypothetical protein MJI37_31630, partial [Salmonella enterica subsp. enterica serovar Cerro]|nr:hypothetical protein [Salmonella enterica subsp. enterica serovar Cerro]
RHGEISFPRSLRASSSQLCTTITRIDIPVPIASPVDSAPDSASVGSLLGPSFAAMLMQNYSDNLLFIMIASVSFIYLLMLLRNAG